MTDLLPIDELIKEARRQGASFGHGDPRVHLAYLTKLGLIPQSIRRKISGEMTGCYPQETIKKILEVEKLKNEGMSYSQIKLHLTIENPSSIINPQPLSSTLNPLSSNQSNGLAFLLIGLFLGFLAATNSINSTSNTIKTNSQAALPVSSLDNSGVNLVKLTGNQNSSDQPILGPQSEARGPQTRSVYLIAVPKQNFSNLGKMDINSLNN